MTTGNESAVATVTDNEQKTAFLEFLVEFLKQFTRKSEAMSMHQIAYFLSMAVMEAADTLDKLKTAPDPRTALELIKSVA